MTCDHNSLDRLTDLPPDSPARTRIGWSTRLNDRQREALWLNLAEPCPACRRETLERIASEAPPPPPPRLAATWELAETPSRFDIWSAVVGFAVGLSLLLIVAVFGGVA